jgi:hypothetical protein
MLGSFDMIRKYMVFGLYFHELSGSLFYMINFVCGLSMFIDLY